VRGGTCSQSFESASLRSATSTRSLVSPFSIIVRILSSYTLLLCGGCWLCERKRRTPARCMPLGLSLSHTHTLYPFPCICPMLPPSFPLWGTHVASVGNSFAWRHTGHDASVYRPNKHAHRSCLQCDGREPWCAIARCPSIPGGSPLPLSLITLTSASRKSWNCRTLKVMRSLSAFGSANIHQASAHRVCTHTRARNRTKRSPSPLTRHPADRLCRENSFASSRKRSPSCLGRWDSQPVSPLMPVSKSCQILSKVKSD
jgi:hypothetical protein